MAYSRLNLSDGQVFNASHVSHIEDGIEDCESQLDEVNQSLSELDVNSYYCNSIENLLSVVSSVPNLRAQLFAVYGSDIVSFLTNGASTFGTWYGLFLKNQNAGNFEYLIGFTGTTYCMFLGRCTLDGTVTILKEIASESA